MNPNLNQSEIGFEEIKTEPFYWEKILPPVKKEPEKKTENIPCPICGKVFRKEFDIKRHLYTHTGEKPFKAFKMKLFAFFAAFAVADEIQIPEDDVCYSDGQEVPCSGLARSGRNPGGADRSIDSGERRYADLKAIAAKLWKLSGNVGKNRFDERKYWAYGCHCYLLGDRPLSEMGTGAPKDSLDNKCKAFKDCQKCVREKHGDQCIGEFKKYTWKYAGKRGRFESTNAEGSCERELFQCDLQFAKDTLASAEVFNEEYHAFWSVNGFDNRDPENCPTNGGIPVEHQCCGGYDREYHWIGLNKKKCCPASDGMSGIPTDVAEDC